MNVRPRADDLGRSESSPTVSLTDKCGKGATEALLDIGDRAIGKVSIWRHRMPEASLGIKRGKVPKVCVQAATVWPRAGWIRIQLARDRTGHEVIAIPELHYVGVMKACQHGSCRPFPVRRQDRLPDDQNLKIRIMDSFEQRFGCGGPPQAYWSCWRQQQHHPDTRR